MNATASVFEHGGREYVVVYAGGNLFAGSTRGDRVWLFGLGGALEPEASAGPAAQASDAAGLAAIDVEGGDAALYVDACQSCHGPQGEGGHNGIRLRAALTPERILRTVATGRNDMPSFADEMNTEELRAVVAYVRRMLESR